MQIFVCFDSLFYYFNEFNVVLDSKLTIGTKNHYPPFCVLYKKIYNYYMII